MSNLVEDIERFCSTHKMAESQFGILALNDKNLVPQLRAGRDVRMSTAERVREFIAVYRPEQDAAA